jgi:IclR family acetate operon transcriptional repressor
MAAADGALRTLSVLETLASMEQPATLPEIANQAQLEKFKAYRALRALQDNGFVYHSAGSGYWISSRSHALASLIGPRPAVLRRARPVLARLAELAQAGAALHLRSGSHRVQVCVMVPRHLTVEPASGPIPPGERAPLTTGCSGTAILAFLPPREADAIIASRPREERPPSPSELARIRADGYAMSFSANHRGMNGIGAPLLDPIDGAPLGSVAIGGPEARIDKDALQRLSDPLRAACHQLAKHLAKVLGPNSHDRRAALDVTIQNVLES